jgi:response regulator RpfG family c-di-GMP phosphodiesterase
MDGKTVLCVDDEVNVLNSLKRLLRKESYKLLLASSGKEGLSLLEKEPVHLVISDQRMPEMTGTEFLQIVKQRYPEAVRIILTGYSEANTIIESINKGEIYRYLMKPWDDEELRNMIQECLGKQS